MAERPTRLPNVDPADLYGVSHLLSQESKKELGLIVPATIYPQDPLVAKSNEDLGRQSIYLDWEPGLMDGPTSARIAVVDYNADTGLLAEPARWNEEERRFAVADDEESFQFHQVNAWAVVRNVLAFFEDRHVMGRSIPWAFEGNRLMVVPHAGYMQNAFYDRGSKSLQFYYCGSGQNPVYTCLSHDIVAHETGHAVLDGIRPFYNQISSSQTAAFHEFLADLTAILSALRNNPVRQVAADRSGGDLSKFYPIGDLAEQFGRSLVDERYGPANRYYLRSAGNEETMETIEGKWEPHDCSLVLTGALFDILNQMTQYHLTKDGLNGKPESPREALWNATNHLTRMALRALDYCPPVDIQFADYACALLHADELAYPEDKLEYRDLAGRVFAERGLAALEVERPPYNVQFRRYDIERVSHSRTGAYQFLNENRKLLHIPPQQDFAVVDLYDTDKVVEAERRLPQEIIIEYVWREDVPLQGPRFGEYEGQMISLLCGGTLVFDRRGNVLCFAHKPGTELEEEREEGEKRKEGLLNFVAQLIEGGLIGIAEEREAGCLDIRAPAVIGHRMDGALRLEATPHLLHVEGNKGEGRWTIDSW